jgi:hypothetical protein
MAKDDYMTEELSAIRAVGFSVVSYSFTYRLFAKIDYAPYCDTGEGKL